MLNSWEVAHIKDNCPTVINFFNEIIISVDVILCIFFSPIPNQGNQRAARLNDVDDDDLRYLQDLSDVHILDFGMILLGYPSIFF